MTTIKQLCLGVAVAGVVAGAGSAVGTSVAFADSSGSDTSSSAASDNTGRAAKAPIRGQSRADNAGEDAAPAAAVATPRGGRDDLPAAEVEIPELRDNASSRSAAVLPSGDDDNAAPAVAAETPAAAPPVEPAVRGDSSPAPVAPSIAPAAVVQESAEPVVTVVVAPAVAEAAVLTPAPASPAPVPLKLPLLPDLPALPVTPVSAVTVSATSGANPRVRAASAVAQAAVLADPPVNHVLLIGTDGTNLSKILEYAYDNPEVNSGFRTLMDEGITGATTLVNHTTISGPSWSTILTGVWDNKTGVINNLFDPAPYKKWPTAINLLEYSWGNKVDTAVFADWQYITDMADAGGYPADVNSYIAYQEEAGWEAADDEVAKQTIAYINSVKATDPTFIFSYQVGVDEEGHLHGGASPEYRDALINTAENIADIMAAVDAWEAANPGQEWTVIVTTDHGHQQSQGLGHGFQSPNETTSFIIFDLEGDDANDGKQNLGYKNTDITPTILSLFDVAQRSDFDGVPLQTKTDGIVAPVNLKTSLQDAISMYGYPNIGNDIALGTRTIFASVPYLINGLVNDINGFLQGIVDQDIFLISGLADVTQWIVQFNGDLAVGVTQAIARVVATLTGSGTIPPTDPPLPAPPANSEFPLLLDAAVLT